MAKISKKKKFSNFVIVVAILMIVCYTITCLLIQWQTSTEVSSVLTTAWYSFWTCEVFALAGIKITKVIKKKDEEDE